MFLFPSFVHAGSGGHTNSHGHPHFSFLGIGAKSCWVSRMVNLFARKCAVSDPGNRDLASGTVSRVAYRKLANLSFFVPSLGFERREESRIDRFRERVSGDWRKSLIGTWMSQRRFEGFSNGGSLAMLVPKLYRRACGSWSDDLRRGVRRYQEWAGVRTGISRLWRQLLGIIPFGRT